MSKRWTENELSMALDLQIPAAVTAVAIGRSIVSVYVKRRDVKSGKTVPMDGWQESEDDFILDNPGLSARECAEFLGRPAFATASRRTKLNREHAVVSYRNRIPYHVGGRPLLARTCLDCDLLLDGRFFNSSGGRWSQRCTRCVGKKIKSSPSRQPENRRGKNDTGWQDRLQALSLESAANHRKPWTERDDLVLMDPSASRIVKALRLGRTYISVSNRAHKIGAKSVADWHLGSVEDGQWNIKFPEAAVGA